ncbi:MAG: MurR/RpiR family transcriptional regulator [Actinomycetaceae bacterium]|nr:MurR/RpiR family transcriptional regulator [Arcanobacterium sp.]MDD7687120.1 MurR/RpiR family transcriptional regulator [Actinomycetaceae bacterium]MDY5273215.1 MurR/RpiR family transcriptional regulator [Arcanobacterium sp.]
MDASLFQRIAQQSTATPTEEKLKNYFVERYPQLAFDTIEAVCAAVNTSTASVTRYVRRLGYRGYRDFSASLKAEIAENFDSPDERAKLEPDPSSPGTALRHHIDDAIGQLRTAGEIVNAQMFDTIADLLRDDDRPLYLLSNASGKQLMRYFYLLIRYHRSHVHLIESADVAPHELLDLAQKSVLFVTAFDRHAVWVRNVMAVAQERGATVALMTNRLSSPLQAYADISLHLPGNTPGRFRTRAVFLVFLEALVDALENEHSDERVHDIEHIYQEMDLFISPKKHDDGKLRRDGGKPRRA